MTDNLSADDRKKTMRAVKSTGTSLERILWSMLAGSGISGWKKNDNSIVGKPDVAFHNKKIAIFIDGCFWHNCPYCKRPFPKNNSNYWSNKINQNCIRDKKINNGLVEMGWKVIRIWEHDIKNSDNYQSIRFQLLKTINERKNL